MLMRMAIFVGCCLLPIQLLSANDKSELAQFQGNWKVTQLVENGQVVPADAIKRWLPSGGRARISENAIIFKSGDKGQDVVKLFSVDVTKYPKGIDLRSRDDKQSRGIYRFDDGRLIVCFSDPATESRPTEFSAAKGSNRMLMTLSPVTEVAATPTQRQTQPAPREDVPAPAAKRVLTDDDVRRMLVGVWQFNDSLGPLLATINANGTYSTSRDVAQVRLFQTVFTRQLESTGTWSVQNGQLVYHVATSTRIERAGLMIAVYVRSISERDLIFVDGLGRVGSAVKVQ